MSLATLLSEVRQRQGFSIRTLADRSGVGKSTISRWERGQTLPSIPELDAVLGCLDVAESERSLALDLLPRPRARRGSESFLFSGDLLRALRYRAGLSLDATAQRTNVTKAALSRWESGERTPTEEALQRVAGVLNASEFEVDALIAGLSAPPHRSEPFEARLSRLKQAVRVGSAEPLDLEFISLEYDARHEAHTDLAYDELASRIRALYIEWLGWWYRDREAALWADRQMPRMSRGKHLPIWGRIIRAKNVFLSEYGPKEPAQRMEILNSSLAALRGTSSEAFVLRELANELIHLGDYEEAMLQVRKARECTNTEEEPETHRFCCDMVETTVWLAKGNIDQAMMTLPVAIPNDPYLQVSSTVGRAKVLVAAGFHDRARVELEKVYVESVAHGYHHFARSAQTELATLTL